MAGAALVQESAPERLELKQELLGELDALADPEALVASSTSGYPLSQLIARCRVAPERVLVAHPFNPVYLVPLVELAGSSETPAALLDRAEALYAGAGKTVLRVDGELDGFVANRLQEAIWREALHMLAAGEATVEELSLIHI